MALEDKVWKLHCQGYAPSQISEKLYVSVQRVKDIVIYFWRMDRSAKAE